MAEDQKSQGWWQTVPGILTATAGIITAIAGLIVALHQAGVFATAPRQGPPPPSSTTTASPPTSPPAGTGTGASPTSPTGSATTYPRALAAGAEVRVGGAVYRILAAQLDRRNAETLTLRFTVRMTNGERFPANLWDESFRLRVDGVPSAPVGNLNKVVPAQSAEEGVVEFVIPAAAQAVVLLVRQGDESTEIAVDLSGKPRG
jgi:hypothetical protein